MTPWIVPNRNPRVQSRFYPLQAEDATDCESKWNAIGMFHERVYFQSVKLEK